MEEKRKRMEKNSGSKGPEEVTKEEEQKWEKEKYGSEEEAGDEEEWMTTDELQDIEEIWKDFWEARNKGDAEKAEELDLQKRGDLRRRTEKEEG